MVEEKFIVQFFNLFNGPINQMLYLLFNTVFPPLALMCWIYMFSLVLYTNRRKVRLAVFFTICIFYEIFLIIFIFTAPDIVGIFSGTTYRLTAQPFAIVFQIFAVVTTLITGT
ncbi:MAG: hypothetical protein GF383_01875 [Candidatus Lokiarchaeota archaeon]|nr:hypothetical protein [Candidatus Lokiarchaeota archaeon]MBD3338093.1 hypothetical protein [Candidatus Lokiarchaeota archaeon]